MAEPEVDDWAPGLVTFTPFVMAHEKLVEPEKPLPSVAVTVTEAVPVLLGVPVMAPVVASMASPTGRPVADQVSVAPACESVADGVTGVMAEPVRLERLAMGETVTELVMVHVKAAEPAWPPPSRAVRTTEKTPDAVGVPVMVPVDELIERPAGRPVADQVSVAPLSVSVAELASGVIAVPVSPDWFPGLVTETVEETDQANDAEPLNPAPSVAVTVTDDTPGVVGVPEMVPIDELIERPAGRPVADQVSVAPAWVSVAELVSGVMAEPAPEDWADLPVTVTVLVTVQVKAAEPAWPLLSLAVSTTDAEPGVVGVPVMVPVELLIESPAGRPVADQVITGLEAVSVAELVTGAMAEPVTLDWLPGLATEMTEVTIQTKLVEPENEAVSVAVTVTA
jgi:hypothetical protein